MNQKLIKQVQEGTHCIEFNLHRDSPETLRALTTQIWPKSLAQPNGTEEYYFNFIDPQHWDSKTNLPTGLTPIPLDDFFKEDSIEAYKECFGIDIKPSTPEQQPEELLKKFDVGITITPDNELCITKLTKDGAANFVINEDGSACFSFIHKTEKGKDMFQFLPSLPEGKDTAAAQWFDNNSDSYDISYDGNGSKLEVPTMSKETFLKYIKSINNGK